MSDACSSLAGYLTAVTVSGLGDRSAPARDPGRRFLGHGGPLFNSVGISVLFQAFLRPQVAALYCHIGDRANGSSNLCSRLTDEWCSLVADGGCRMEKAGATKGRLPVVHMFIWETAKWVTVLAYM